MNTERWKLFTGIVTVLICAVVQADVIVVAGWDNWAGATNSSVSAAGITAIRSFGVVDGTAAWGNVTNRFDNDETFGALGPGASGNNPSVFITTADKNTSSAYIEFTVENNGSEDYRLDYFSFDAWRINSKAMDTYSLSITGGDFVLTNNFASGSLLVKGGIPAKDGDSYDDFDVSLAGLPDRMLNAGESVTLRLTFTDSDLTDGGDGIYVDNMALISIPEPASLSLFVVAGAVGAFGMRAASRR